jgi:hypothetical protein
MIDWDAAVLAPCMAVFGEDLKPTYQRASGGVPFDFDAVFDDAYLALVINADSGDPEIATIEPVIGVRLVQFGATPPKKGDTVTIPRVGKTYLVSAVEPDGKGWALLRLTIKA